MNDEYFQITCDHCGNEYKVKELDQRKSYSCGHCHHLVSVKPVSHFLAGAGPRPYRDLIQHYIKEKSSSRLQDAVAAEELLLPNRLRGLVDAYIRSLSLRFEEDKDYWKTATCREAFETIIQVAMEILPIDTMVATQKDAFRKENQKLMYSLFKIANLNFAYSASIHPKQRKLMGVRNNLFN